jgi:hypothetical protein
VRSFSDDADREILIASGPGVPAATDRVDDHLRAGAGRFSRICRKEHS